MLRERVLLRGFAALLRGFAAPLRDPELAAAGLRAAVERLDELLVDFARVDDFARVAGFLAVLLRDVLDFFAVELDDFRAPPLDDPAEDAREDELPLDPLSPPHLPDITRCAASATASAMIVPSRVALDIIVFAACEALSAASRPASRILRRAAGLALIAAAAAASPAASISLLIAALASLSTVLSPPDRDFELEEPDELFRVDLAIASSPSRRAISVV